MAQRFKRQLRVCLWLRLPPHLRNAHTWQNVSDKLHYGDIGYNSQTVKPKIQKLSALTTLNRENTTKCAQNVHRELWQKQRDGDTTDWWLQQQSNGQAISIRRTVSVSVLQNVIKIKRLKWRYYTGFAKKRNCTVVLSRLRNTSSIFLYKISSVLNNCMLKILWLFVDTVYYQHRCTIEYPSIRL